MISKETVKRITRKILSNYQISCYEICIAFLDNKSIRKLNRKYLNHDCPTDVLTFPYPSKELKKKKSLNADIAISAQMAIKNSKYFKTPVKEELCLYIVHALLHSLGFDDTSRAKRLAMRKEEKFWIKGLNPLIKKL